MRYEQTRKSMVGAGVIGIAAIPAALVAGVWSGLAGAGFWTGVAAGGATFVDVGANSLADLRSQISGVQTYSATSKRSLKARSRRWISQEPLSTAAQPCTHKGEHAMNGMPAATTTNMPAKIELSKYSPSEVVNIARSLQSDIGSRILHGKG